MNANTIQELLNNQFGITLVFDDEGILYFMSQGGEQELGYKWQETNIRQICAAMFPEDRDIPSHMEKINGREVHTIICRANRTSFSALVRCAVLHIKGITINIATVYNLQQTEEAIVQLMKTQSEIKESIKSRNEFVANVTHELRTPVNGIKGHVTNLMEQTENADSRKILDIVLGCCGNMEKIINNMMDFSKIEAGKFEITEAPFDIRKCVKSVVDTSITIANGKGITLSSYVSDDIPEILIGDDLRIGQILNNLVSNAVKFTSIGYVRIEVYRTMQKNNQVELTFFVIDTGIGVTAEEKEKMFKSFSQVDGSVTRQYGGTGLGLYVSKQLIDLMHGTIDLESEKGKGSTFRFTLLLNVGGSCEGGNEVLEKITMIDELRAEIRQSADTLDVEQIYQFGSGENRAEISRNIERLTLCIEMGNWGRAEQFAENIKKLCEDAPKDVKNKIFRMQMSVRKENYEKSISGLEGVKTELSNVLPQE